MSHINVFTCLLSNMDTQHHSLVRTNKLPVAQTRQLKHIQAFLLIPFNIWKVLKSAEHILDLFQYWPQRWSMISLILEKNGSKRISLNAKHFLLTSREQWSRTFVHFITNPKSFNWSKRRDKERCNIQLRLDTGFILCSTVFYLLFSGNWIWKSN